MSDHFHCCDEVDADEAYRRGLAEGMAAGIREPCVHDSAPYLETVVREMLLIIDRTTPLSVGEPLVQRILADLSTRPCAGDSPYCDEKCVRCDGNCS